MESITQLNPQFQNGLLMEILKTQLSQSSPPDFFRLWCGSSALHQVCETKKLQIWTTYFETDILPFLFENGVEFQAWPNYPFHEELRADWTAMQQRIVADPTTPNNEIYELYQHGLDRIFRTSWWFAERLRDYIFARLVRPDSLPVELPSFLVHSEKSITMTSLWIHNLCRLRRRMRIPTTTIDMNAKNPLLHIRARLVWNWAEFAVWALDAVLLRDVIETWASWFYFYRTAPIEQGYQTDLLRNLIEVLARVLEYSGQIGDTEKLSLLLQTFVDLFMVPTHTNPKGRYADTYSNEVKEMLQPQKSTNGSYRSTGDQILEAGSAL